MIASAVTHYQTLALHKTRGRTLKHLIKRHDSKCPSNKVGQPRCRSRWESTSNKFQPRWKGVFLYHGSVTPVQISFGCLYCSDSQEVCRSYKGSAFTLSFQDCTILSYVLLCWWFWTSESSGLGLFDDPLKPASMNGKITARGCLSDTGLCIVTGWTLVAAT